MQPATKSFLSSLLTAAFVITLILIAFSCTTNKHTSKTTTKETTTDDITSVITTTTTEIAQGTVTTVSDTITGTRSIADLFDGDSLVKETPLMEIVTKLDKKGNITTTAIAKPQTLHYNVNKTIVSQEVKKEHKATASEVVVKDKDVQRESIVKPFNLNYLWWPIGIIAVIWFCLFLWKRRKTSAASETK